MTQTMIERVARAIHKERFGDDVDFDNGPSRLAYHSMQGARAAIKEIAKWHSEQGESFRKMANDDRLSDYATAKALSASKHHAGTAASMRSILIGNRDADLHKGR